jgi:L-lysine 2,3-aminomutase
MTEQFSGLPEDGDQEPQDGGFESEIESSEAEEESNEGFEDYARRLSDGQQYETLLKLEEEIIENSLFTQNEFNKLVVNAYTLSIHDWLQQAVDIERQVLEVKASLPDSNLDTDDDGGAMDARLIAQDLMKKRRQRMLTLIPEGHLPPTDEEWQALMANIWSIEPTEIPDEADD